MNMLTPAIVAAPSAIPAISEAEAERFRLEIRDGIPRLDSRVIAQRFEKRHSDVLRSIDLLIQRRPELALRNFAEGSWTSSLTGQQRHRNFLVDRDGFALLAMGFTGDAALAWKLDYLDAFNRMEAMIRSWPAPAIDLDDNQVLRRILVSKLDEVDSLRATAEAERRARIEAEDVACLSNQEMLDMGKALTVVTHRAEASAARLEVLQPKAVAYERIAGARGSKTITDFARDTRLKPKRVFEVLERRAWICRRNSREIGKKGSWMATVWGQERGYVEHAMGAVDVAGNIIEKRQLVITPAGQRVLEAELAQGRLDLRKPRKG